MGGYGEEIVKKAKKAAERRAEETRSEGGDRGWRGWQAMAKKQDGGERGRE
jgi:hypothetical protein